MSNTRQYYFDVLPPHPQPERLETFCSYVTRLAEANHINSMPKLASFFFSCRSVSAVRRLNDFTPQSFGVLHEIAGCSQATLQSTTFFHLSRKFGRLPFYGSLNAFLQGSIGSNLRYCPKCLAEDAVVHYSLLWRFLSVPICHKHGCRLLNYCGHCERELPLFALPAKIAHCPACKGDLRRCVATSVSEQEVLQIGTHISDLEFLLLPSQSETNRVTVEAIERKLAYMRRRRDLMHAELAKKLQISIGDLEAIEQNRKSAKLINYMKYAQYMEVSLGDLIDIHFLEDMPQNHEELVERVNEAIKGLETLREPVGWSTLARAVGISRRLLGRSVQVRTILAQYKDRMYQEKSLQFLQREGILVERVREAVSELEALGEVAQRKEICRIVGLKYGTLIRYPRVKAIFDQCRVKQQTYRAKKRQEREQELVEQVQAAMQVLESIKAPMSQREVAKLVGLTVGSLREYPRVRAILEEWSKDHHRFPKRRNEAPEDVAENQGEELIEQVHAAIRELVDRGETISQRSVCGILGISIWKLNRSLRARTVVNRYATEYRLRDYQQLEDQLLERVQISISVFKSEGRFVSKRAVLKAAGVPHHLLHRYPRINALLDEYSQDRLAHQSQQKLQREVELVKQVQDTISELRAAGTPVTQAAISNTIGISLAKLRYYPRVKQLLERITQERA